MCRNQTKRSIWVGDRFVAGLGDELRKSGLAWIVALPGIGLVVVVSAGFSSIREPTADPKVCGARNLNCRRALCYVGSERSTRSPEVDVLVPVCTPDHPALLLPLCAHRNHRVAHRALRSACRCSSALLITCGWADCPVWNSAVVKIDYSGPETSARVAGRCREE